MSPEGALLVFLAALTVVSLLLFVLFGRDKKPEASVLKHAPSGLNSAEIGYVIDGWVDYGDVLSLLLAWAARGHLEIRRSGGGYGLARRGSLGEDAEPYEKYLFDWLFKPGDEVEAQHYKYISFRSILNKTRRMVAKSLMQRTGGVFTLPSRILRRVLACFTAFPLLSSLILSLHKSMSVTAAVAGAGILCFLLLQPEFGIIGLLQRWRGWRPGRRTAALARRVALLLVSFAAFLVFYLRGEPDLTLALAAMASTVAVGLCAAFTARRTPAGREMLAQAEGLRRFIMEAEKSEIAELKGGNGAYFLSVLPYAYVFGLAGEWAGKFGSIRVDQPKWFTGIGSSGGRVSSTRLAGELNRAMYAFLRNLTFVPRATPRF